MSAITDMESGIKISICLIAYNQENTIGATLDSIFAQRLTVPYEVLVADDASVDDTPEIIKKYKKAHPGIMRIILRKDNVGPTKNAYTILHRSRGQYIASLEGDDKWIDANFLQKQIDYLDSHEEYIATAGKCRIIDSNGDILDKSVFPENVFWNYDRRTYGKKEFEKWLMPGHISAVVYRNFYKEYQRNFSIFYKIHDYIGDRTTLMQLVVRGEIYCFDDVVLEYRFVENGDNWMSQWNKRNRRFEEFKLISDLERNAWLMYGINLNMDQLKKSKIAAAAIVLYLNNNIDNLVSFFRIIKYDKAPIKDIRTATIAIKQKRYWIRKGQPDHRVEV